MVSRESIGHSILHPNRASHFCIAFIAGRGSRIAGVVRTVVVTIEYLNSQRGGKYLAFGKHLFSEHLNRGRNGLNSSKVASTSRERSLRIHWRDCRD